MKFLLKSLWILPYMLIALPIWSNNPPRATNSISGTVSSEATGETIPYANIVIVGQNTRVSSNVDGQFEIADLSAGNYRLRVQSIGYQSQEISVDVDETHPSIVDFKLYDDRILLDELVVSATRNEVSRKDAPIVVNVLNSRLFEKVNSLNLAQSLSYQSGLRVENNCQNCGFPQVRINGLEGPYSQILLDSRPIVSALSGVYGLEQIPVNMIDRVEVIRGGASALFGANAVGGTINIITKDPVENSFQLTSNIANLDGKSMEQNFTANASLVSSENIYGIALYQSYHNRNPYDRDDDGFSEIGKLNQHTFGFRSYYRPNDSGRLNLEYHTTNEFRRGGNKLNQQPHETDITEQTKHIINSGGLSYDQYFREDKHKISTFASVQHVDRNSYYGAEQDPNAYGKTNDLTWVVGSQYVGRFEKFLFSSAQITAGLEYQSDEMHDEMIGYDRDLLQKIHIASGFAQSEWKIDQFTILAGARLDKHNLIENPIISPRLNFMYKPSDDFQGRLTYSTGFRAPQAYDEDLHITQVGGKGMVISLASGLKPERSNSFSGSVDLSRNWEHFQFNLLIEGFYTDLRDVFVLEVIDEQPGIIYQERRNGSGAKIYGMNLDGKIAHGRNLQLQAGFTIQKSIYKEKEAWSENPDVAPTKNMMRTPNNYGYFTFSHFLNKQFDYSITGVYTGKMYVPHFSPEGVVDDYEYKYIKQDELVRTPRFFELNFKLNYNFELRNSLKMQVNCGIQNILNSFQKDLDKGTFRDSGYFYGPTQPRTFFVGLKIMG